MHHINRQVSDARHGDLPPTGYNAVYRRATNGSCEMVDRRQSAVLSYAALLIRRATRTACRLSFIG